MTSSAPFSGVGFSFFCNAQSCSVLPSSAGCHATRPNCTRRRSPPPRSLTILNTISFLIFARVAGSFSLRKNAGVPPARAHAGTRMVMPVYVAVYGYWSIITSMPSRRAASTSASVSRLRPHIGWPTTL